MAAAAILNLSFLSILITWSTSGSSRRHCCKTSIGGWIIAVSAKIQDGGCRHLRFYFLFNIMACMYV